MKKLLFNLGVFLAVSMTVHGQIIDPFTSPDSVTYDFYNSYNGTPTLKGSSSNFGSVSGGVWSPVGVGQNTDHFVVDNSSVKIANIGDSVSLSINLGSSAGDFRALGLVLSDSLTPSASVPQQELLFQDTTSGYDLSGLTSGNGNKSVQTGYSTLTVTHTGLDTFSASVSGGGITPFSYNFTFDSTNDYVGLGTFSNFGGLNGVTAKNFTLDLASTAPEPSAAAMLGLGLFALLGLVLRRRTV